MLRISPTAENRQLPATGAFILNPLQPTRLLRSKTEDARYWSFDALLVAQMAMPQPSWGLGGPEVPSSPRTMRTLRKIQSHQVLTTSSALIAQTQSSHLSATRGTDARSSTTQSGSIRAPARRPRSNSDAAAREASLVAPIPTQRRPARKTGSGVGIKRSLLENLVRDGPQNGNTKEALQELKYLVLSTGVDADGDGMVSDRTLACEIPIMDMANFCEIAVPISSLPMAYSPER